MEYEYIFGVNGNAETLRVKGPFHTVLSGFQQVERKYPGETVSHRFRVVRRLKSDKDQAGNCYDWYEIDRHYRTVDKSAALQAELEAVRQKLATSIQSNAVLVNFTRLRRHHELLLGLLYK